MTGADMSIETLLAQTAADPNFSCEALFGYLQRLLNAPAPNSGAGLPGAVGEVIANIAAELGLTLSADPRIRATGNLAIEIGAQNAAADLLITAHMDRPSFRVLNLAEASLYPLCAIRTPHARYRCGAIALRYQGGRVETVARGALQFSEVGGGGDVGEFAGEGQIRFEVESGKLDWGDTILMAAQPKLVARRDQRQRIKGTGLDNASGLLVALLAARTLSALEGEFAASGRWQGRKVIFAFTDQEEGPPSGLFGQGAARLAQALSPPKLGFINVDAHNAHAPTGHAPGVGASHAFVSGYGRGSVAPLEAQALATDLAGSVNRARPGTVKLNYAYVSRSDDMLLSLRARCLGLIGVVLENAHTTEETVALADVAAAATWVSAFLNQLLTNKV